VKLPQYRAVPVSLRLIEHLDLVFGLRLFHKQNDSLAAQMPFWSMSRTTAYRLIKRVMARANIKGKQATAKGLRHSKCILLKVLLSCYTHYQSTLKAQFC
jgi:integrase/recombinase XerD